MSSTSKRKMLIIGPAPLSIGGVAIHIRRLANLLKDDLDITYVDEALYENKLSVVFDD